MHFYYQPKTTTVYLKAIYILLCAKKRSLGSTGGNKFRHIMFIIIESGMALFAMQLVRVVLAFLPVPVQQEAPFQAASNFVVVINQMLNVIIIISTNFFFFFANNVYLARELHQR